MNATLDFQTRIDSINKILGIGEYTTAATEAVKLIEQALRRMVSQYLDQVDDKVRSDVQEAVKKRVRGDGGIDKLTMGQMIYTLRDAKFLEDWARVTNKSLSSLSVIDLEKLSQLRNKIMHDGAEATKTEAEFLLYGLKMILEIFGLMTFLTTPEIGASQPGQPVLQTMDDLYARIIDFLKSLPNLADETMQRAFITEFDAGLREHIRCGLPLAEFVPLLVTTAVNYGELQDGRHALHAVLEAAQQYIGRDRQTVGMALIQELGAYLQTISKQSATAIFPGHDRTERGSELNVVRKTENHNRGGFNIAILWTVFEGLFPLFSRRFGRDHELFASQGLS